MLADTVTSALREAISDGEFEPGQQLSEIRATERFDCSRNTLREAFAMLVDFVRDLYLARAALEPAGVRWGTFDDPGALVTLTTSAREHLDEPGHAMVSNINQRFHRALVASLGSVSLDREMSNLLARMRLSFLRVIPRYPDLHASHIDGNVELATLIAEGKREDAAELSRATLLGTLDKILAVLN